MVQHALAFDTPPAAPRALTALPTAAQRLWFCAYLPNLSLEASGSSKDARVVVEEQRGIHRVLLACPAASHAGIQIGQSAHAALALLPTLRIEERSTLREQQAVERLATWLEQFTSVVCIAGPDLLLLEIAGSLRLYGGLSCLRQQLAAGLRQQGFTAAMAIAPTPLAATWLARAGRRACVREAANIARVLRDLPLSCLDWPVAICDAMRAMGVIRIGDCLRLPREGFARRFGVQRLLELDRALGRLPDPRTSWRAPERFCADYEMTGEQSDREILLAVCHELLLSLERFLLTRQLGTQQLWFSFFHLRAPATQMPLGGAEFERHAEHWSELLRIRFERVLLPEPVIAVRLQAGRSQVLPAVSGRLALQTKPGEPGRRYSMSQLVERLAARMGCQAVQSVATIAEHRPQRAWRLLGLPGNSVVTKLAAIRCQLCRPLWMLPEPTVLSAEHGYPWLQGRLTLLEGPERLETGWWDDDGIARDYYTAVNPQGLRLWVFRNRKHAPAWYLHGFFG
ncbi:MAG: DNA polymerase Y family protein [Gammaproteobacteria bacterium]|nr:DNA polymerase Y family protein [Gammaproteobacteria bacterium]MDH5303954.1 DNA polymerase Y family protein [Gammaproteobacteria bacterium]MDH5321111.1 DNA polymerase Y family protein [Gammaproteobacteria bacterium]